MKELTASIREASLIPISHGLSTIHTLAYPNDGKSFIPPETQDCNVSDLSLFVHVVIFQAMFGNIHIECRFERLISVVQCKLSPYCITNSIRLFNQQ